MSRDTPKKELNLLSILANNMSFFFCALNSTLLIQTKSSPCKAWLDPTLSSQKLGILFQILQKSAFSPGRGYSIDAPALLFSCAMDPPATCCPIVVGLLVSVHVRALRNPPSLLAWCSNLLCFVSHVRWGKIVDSSLLTPLRSAITHGLTRWYGE